MPEENRPESNPTEMAGPTRSAETVRALIRKTKRATRRRFPTEDKIRILMEGIRGEVSVAELCRREGIHATIYYKWLKDFMEAGKGRMRGDGLREALRISSFSDFVVGDVSGACSSLGARGWRPVT